MKCCAESDDWFGKHRGSNQSFDGSPYQQIGGRRRPFAVQSTSPGCRCRCRRGHGTDVGGQECQHGAGGVAAATRSIRQPCRVSASTNCDHVCRQDRQSKACWPACSVIIWIVSCTDFDPNFVINCLHAQLCCEIICTYHHHHNHLYLFIKQLRKNTLVDNTWTGPTRLAKHLLWLPAPPPKQYHKNIAVDNLWIGPTKKHTHTQNTYTSIGIQYT